MIRRKRNIMKRVNSGVLINLVRRIFDSGLSAFGLIPIGIQQKDDFFMIRYESEALFLYVVLVMPDYEMNVKIGRVGVEDLEGHEPFDLSELLFVSKDVQFEQVIAPDEHTAVVQGLFNNLMNMGERALNNDDLFFEILAHSRKERANAFKIDEQQKQIRAQAEVMWSAGKRREASKLYKELNLPSKVELMRMKIYLSSDSDEA
jgi:hypothetical protein